MERFCRNVTAMSATNFALQLQRNIIARDILKGLKVWPGGKKKCSIKP